MVPLLLAVVVGALVGALRRPLGAHLADVVVIVPWAAVAGVALHLGLPLLDREVAGAALGVSLALLLGFTVCNRHLVGLGVCSVGLALNVAVVLANGGMPVRASALVSSGAVTAEELVVTDLGAGRHFEATDEWLPILGDAIPVRAVGAAMSFGDLIVLAGVGALAGDLTRHIRGRARRRGERVVDLRDRTEPSAGDRAPADRWEPPGPVVVEDHVPTTV